MVWYEKKQTYIDNTLCMYILCICYTVCLQYITQYVIRYMQYTAHYAIYYAVHYAVHYEPSQINCPKYYQLHTLIYTNYNQ